MQVKAIIFDLDGVIVSTEHNHYVAWKRTAEDLGISFDEKANEKLKGLSRIDSLKTILRMGNIEISPSRFNNLLEEKNNFYKDSIQSISQKDLLPGVLELLKEAKDKGIPMAIGSASKNAPFIIDLLKLRPFFTTIVDGSMVDRPKPDPEVFLLGAKHMGVNPQDCIVFEDAESGIKAAKDGGFIAFGVGNENVRGLAHHYINNLTEFKLNENI
jgi:beta-phosphoglucomutase